MFTYLLVGGIGSGKSMASSMLREKGAACIDLDRIGHEVLLQSDTRELLEREFGGEIIDSAGLVDRRALARIAFASAISTCRLNDIMHPRIVERTLELLEDARAYGVDKVVIEASAFDGPNGRFRRIVDACQGIIAIVAPLDVRMQRAVTRDMSISDVRNRMDRQPTDEQFESWADYLIENGGTPIELQSQVDALWEWMSR